MDVPNCRNKVVASTSSSRSEYVLRRADVDALNVSIFGILCIGSVGV